MTGVQKTGLFKRLQDWAKKLKRQLIMLHLAYKDKRTPWHAKLLIFLIIAYALSPIDLIPDFIPIIGYMDDLILLPIGIYLAIKLIPENVKVECWVKAKTYPWNKKKNWWVALLVLLLWAFIIYLIFNSFIK